MIDLFIDAHQYGKIHQARSDASSAKHKVDAFEYRLENLDRRVDKLTLACQALWEVLKERTEITEEEIFAKMEDIDLRDGRKDGKIGGQVMTCSQCGRNINSKRPVCIYCGQVTRTGNIVE